MNHFAAIVAGSLLIVALLAAVVSLFAVDSPNQPPAGISKRVARKSGITATAPQTVDSSGPQRELIDAYKPALELSADKTKGQAVFKRECAACHLLEGIGFAIGPDLVQSQSRDAESLLTQILDPNLFVLPTYFNYQITHFNGTTSTGLLSDQNEKYVTLKSGEGKLQTIDRTEIEEISSLGVSMMPAGFERTIKPEEMSDLIAYVLDVQAEAKGVNSAHAQIATAIPLVQPDQGLWKAVNAFPQLKFFEPLSLKTASGNSDELYVLERRGTIVRFVNQEDTDTKTVFLDISDRVDRTVNDDDGAMDFEFHPEFGQQDSPNRGFIYVGYTTMISDQRYDRLSRFELVAGADVVSPDSETVLIEQLDENRWHNWGSLLFGPDGFLYVAIGDEGDDGTVEDTYENGQKIDRDLFAGILRIDVDRRGKNVSHPPPRQPATGKTADYFIPDDNPFVGIPNALEEFWAIGFRMPYRMSFDGNDRLWVGDVGSRHREEVNLVQRGGNYGWSYLEGSKPVYGTYLFGQPPSPYHGTEQLPFFEYEHDDEENRCVIGGIVYRGNEFPKLRGKYIYGDNGSGKIWALEFFKDQIVANVELLDLPDAGKSGLTSFGEDSSGEIYICVAGLNDTEAGRILKLARTDQAKNRKLPARLSETGIFLDVETLSPAPGFIPYEVNTPLWADGAINRWWISVPGDGTADNPVIDRVNFHPDDAWHFPVGTMFVKHFEIALNQSEPEEIHRLETRILIRSNDSAVYGLNYKWNEDQSDAVLLDSREEEVLQIVQQDGSTARQTWTFPSRHDCLVCHNKNAGWILGVNARQLNSQFDYPGSKVLDNQIHAWNHIGMFAQKLTDAEIADLKKMVAINDETAELQLRTRSYLDANCAHCHRPGGAARAQFDARFETPLAEQKLVNSVVMPGDPQRSQLINRLCSEEASLRMPPIGSGRNDRVAINTFQRWAESMLPTRIRWTAILASMIALAFGNVTIFNAALKNPSSKWKRITIPVVGVLISISLVTAIICGADTIQNFGQVLYLPIYSWMAIGIVLVLSTLLALKHVRKFVGNVPQSQLIGVHLVRISAVSFLILGDGIRLHSLFKYAAAAEIAIAILAFVLAIGLATNPVGRERRTALMIMNWNLAGIVSGAFMLVLMGIKLAPVLSQYPLLLISMIVMPLVIVAHIYSLCALRLGHSSGRIDKDSAAGHSDTDLNRMIDNRDYAAQPDDQFI